MTHPATGRTQSCSSSTSGASSSTSSISRSALRQQQRPRPFAAYTRLFSEGEDSSSGGPVAESGGEVGGEAGGAAVVEEEKPPMSEAELAQKAKMDEIQRLRSKEKFVTVQTGVCLCFETGGDGKPVVIDPGQQSINLAPNGREHEPPTSRTQVSGIVFAQTAPSNRLKIKASDDKNPSIHFAWQRGK